MSANRWGTIFSIAILAATLAAVVHELGDTFRLSAGVIACYAGGCVLTLVAVILGAYLWLCNSLRKLQERDEW